MNPSPGAGDGDELSWAEANTSGAGQYDQRSGHRWQWRNRDNYLIFGKPGFYRNMVALSFIIIFVSNRR